MPNALWQEQAIKSLKKDQCDKSITCEIKEVENHDINKTGF